MKDREPFGASDLDELDKRILSRADEVVAMREIAAGERDPLVIGLRHDVDNRLEPVLAMSDWETERGYRSTYFILHDSPYWDDSLLRPTLDDIASRGHEIALHANGIATALRTGGDPDVIVNRALARLRSWGHNVTGVCAHGDPLCGVVKFVNDEMFEECVRPEYGQPTRTLKYMGHTVRLRPRPLADFGLEYDSYRAGPRGLYLSDSGGSWDGDGGGSSQFYDIANRFPSIDGQLHVLQHPCWWVNAFDKVVA